MWVSPRCRRGARARGLAKRINAPLAIIDKRRERPGESEVMNVIGESPATLLLSTTSWIRCHAGECRRRADANGAKEVYAYISHGVLSGGAAPASAGSRLENSSSTDSSSDRRAVTKAANIGTLSTRLIAKRSARTASGKISVFEPVRLSRLRRVAKASACPHFQTTIRGWMVGTLSLLPTLRRHLIQSRPRHRSSAFGIAAVDHDLSPLT